jgi:hypothetical protein
MSSLSKTQQVFELVEDPVPPAFWYMKSPVIYLRPATVAEVSSTLTAAIGTCQYIVSSPYNLNSHHVITSL